MFKDYINKKRENMIDDLFGLIKIDTVLVIQ